MRPPLWIGLVLLLAAAAMLAGCTTSTTNAPANSAAPTTAGFRARRRRLVMLTEEYAPLNYQRGRPTGRNRDRSARRDPSAARQRPVDRRCSVPALGRGVQPDPRRDGHGPLRDRAPAGARDPVQVGGTDLSGAGGSLRPSRAQHHDRLSVRTAGLPDRGGAGRCGCPETPRPRRARVRAADSGGSGGPARDGSTRARSTSSPTGSSPDAGLPGARAGTRSGPAGLHALRVPDLLRVQPQHLGRDRRPVPGCPGPALGRTRCRQRHGPRSGSSDGICRRWAWRGPCS